MPNNDPRLEHRLIHRCRQDGVHEVDDPVTVEEPMEIRVDGHSVAVVMRTPGDDLDLTRGFLLTEGIVSDRDDIFEISQCPSQTDDESRGNVVDVILTHPEAVDLEQLSRHVFTSSSCGLCGRATIESVFQQFSPVVSDLAISQELIMRLPDLLRSAQKTFAQTGGLHASALFNNEGSLQTLREDVGRHNALDKVIGSAWDRGWLPLKSHILLVSGRISFELTQKALCAGIPLIAGISAPSTLAIDCAEAGNQCLIGFLRDRGMNIYAHPERVSAQS